jgi:hypothetical protein
MDPSIKYRESVIVAHRINHTSVFHVIRDPPLRQIEYRKMAYEH